MPEDNRSYEKGEDPFNENAIAAADAIMLEREVDGVDDGTGFEEVNAGRVAFFRSLVSIVFRPLTPLAPGEMYTKRELFSRIGGAARLFREHPNYAVEGSLSVEPEFNQMSNVRAEQYLDSLKVSIERAAEPYCAELVAGLRRRKAQMDSESDHLR